MFTIDLLKGQGTPTKSSAENIAIISAAFAVPIIIVIVIFGFYLRNSIFISIQRQKIVNYEAKIAELSEAIKLQESFDRERNIINSSLGEVSSTIGRYLQWSPILVMLVKNMPDSITLTELKAKQSFVRMKVRNEDDPEKVSNISVPVRQLQINVSGNPYSISTGVVKDFKDRIRHSALLGSKLENIRVSQQTGTLDGHEVTSYEIDCTFKPQL